MPCKPYQLRSNPSPLYLQARKHMRCSCPPACTPSVSPVSTQRQRLTEAVCAAAAHCPDLNASAESCVITHVGFYPVEACQRDLTQFTIMVPVLTRLPGSHSDNACRWLQRLMPPCHHQSCPSSRLSQRRGYGAFCACDLTLKSLCVQVYSVTEITADLNAWKVIPLDTPFDLPEVSHRLRFVPDKL